MGGASRRLSNRSYITLTLTLTLNCEKYGFPTANGRISDVGFRIAKFHISNFKFQRFLFSNSNVTSTRPDEKPI